MADLVTSLASSKQSTAVHSKRSLIVEIIGPAGAGKTTLFRALQREDADFQVEYLPPVWELAYIPFFIKNIFLLLPTLARLQATGHGKITRRELAWMAMLLGWPKILGKHAQADRKVLLLDQGPVFLMAILYAFGPTGLRNPEIREYWNKVLNQWTHTLDLVIWLDAPDDILIQRIRTRQDEHLVKEKTDQEIKIFLATYRQVYEQLIESMTTRNRKIRILHLNTEINNPEKLVDCVTGFLHTCNE